MRFSKKQLRFAALVALAGAWVCGCALFEEFEPAAESGTTDEGTEDPSTQTGDEGTGTDGPSTDGTGTGDGTGSDPEPTDSETSDTVPDSQTGSESGSDSGSSSAPDSDSGSQSDSDSQSETVSDTGSDTGECFDDLDCDDGNPCNGLETCDLDGLVCVSSEAPLPGAPCDGDGDGNDEGFCRDGRCKVSICGDGIVDTERDEACDDGNIDPDDGCKNSCAFTCEGDTDCNDDEYCNGEETCDTDSHVCAPGEELADGETCGETSVCRAGVCAPESCGDGALDTDAETCDDGNDVSGDGCELDCTYTCAGDADCEDNNPCDGPETCDLEAHTCVESGQEASFGLPCGNYGDRAGYCIEGECRLTECGDAIHDAANYEECDDGDDDPENGCREDCTYTCHEDEDCFDTNKCNGEEICTASHTCAPGVPLTCVADDPCHLNRCEPEVGCVYPLHDDDSDGHAPDYLGACGDDCNDGNPAVHGEADELCDGIDNDCDNEVDEDDAVNQTRWYLDVDGDGFAAEDADAIWACHDEERTELEPIGNHVDCDDSDSDVHPGADELCDGVDNNCDGVVDGEIPVWFRDEDGDGFAANKDGSQQVCEKPEGNWTTRNPDEVPDCDDTNPDVNPEATEICNEGVDDDCDGKADDDDTDPETDFGSGWYYVDGDNDGYSVGYEGSRQFCIPPESGWTDREPYDPSFIDCEDGDSSIYPGADEKCDDVDRNCDGDPYADAIDPKTWYLDNDGDGFLTADPETMPACNKPDVNWTDQAPNPENIDCDDDDSAVNPDATEICNEGIDDDCDGDADDADTDPESELNGWYYADSDGDGFAANENGKRQFCSDPAEGWTDRQPSDFSTTDCNDNEDNHYAYTVNPSYKGDYQPQSHDGKSYDWNCNGRQEKQYTNIGKCQRRLGGIGCEWNEGWWYKDAISPKLAEPKDLPSIYMVPACGATVTYLVGCTTTGLSCEPKVVKKTQACK